MIRKLLIKGRMNQLKMVFYDYISQGAYSNLVMLDINIHKILNEMKISELWKSHLCSLKPLVFFKSHQGLLTRVCSICDFPVVSSLHSNQSFIKTSFMLSNIVESSQGGLKDFIY
ncbi:hypothetical protein MXB_3392 [Myxobolus squamalis]|nr:hypothetical protein MXB_3392 [Myxobolus squamalis]